MFDTLAYIPPVMAYAFITLLLIILGFVVVYVAHKIYTSLYDNIPVAQLSGKFSCSPPDEFITNSSALFVPESEAQQQEGRKSKTALRIVVTLEPCYLAYMMFESQSSDNPLSPAPEDNQIPTGFGRRHYPPSVTNFNVLVKYFDNLAAIPCSRDIQNCNSFRFDSLFNARKIKYS